MRNRWGFVVAAALLLGAGSVRADEVVYQNHDPNAPDYQPIDQGQQLGDDVTLAGTGRSVTQFQVYVTNQFDQSYTGTFTARFFDIGSDGLPNNQLWQGTLQVSDGQPLENERTLTFQVPNVNVPDHFVWSFQADTNLPPSSADGAFGPIISGPPQIGSSADLVYFNDGTGWQEMDQPYQPDDFGSFDATITAVPEPASFGALALGGLGLFARRRRA